MLRKEERRAILSLSPSRGHLTFFGCYLSRREGWYWHLVGQRGCNAAKYPKMYWTAPHPQQSYLAQNVNSAEVEKPWLRVVILPRWLSNKESACAMKTTWIWSLGWEDPLEEGTASHSSILAWRIPRTEVPGGLNPWGHKESDMTEDMTDVTSRHTYQAYQPLNNVTNWILKSTCENRGLYSKLNKSCD